MGKVKDLAEVRLNGRNLGVVWCEPWRIEITEAVRTGTNELEIVVANEWVNRLIGDSGLPPEKRFTWTTWNPYKPDSPLLESGLLGTGDASGRTMIMSSAYDAKFTPDLVERYSHRCLHCGVWSGTA